MSGTLASSSVPLLILIQLCCVAWSGTSSYTTVGGLTFDDPSVGLQRWFLEAINVTGAWALGYTGKGVNLIFADDALDTTHRDISPRYNPRGSPSANVLPSTRPYMRMGKPTFEFHGTATAGLAAAEANNSECGVGVAFHAKLSFVRFLPNPPSMREGVDNNQIHIYSNSWGYANCIPKNLTALPSKVDYRVVGRTSRCPFSRSLPGSPCKRGCETSPSGWVDAAGDTCERYVSASWCTRDGEQGPGWMNDWGYFMAYAVGGVDASQACCGCGGGIESATPCTGMRWNGSTISSSCIGKIKSYCQRTPLLGAGSYDAACTDHWDLWVDCSHLSLPPNLHANLHHGVTSGRGGRGMIYTFSAGNDFQKGNNVNSGPYEKSIFTIAVGATALDSQHAYYSTPGTPTFISAPGGETANGQVFSSIPAIEGSGTCGNVGQGTSYSCPLVSGVVALMLDANPQLTWRDVQEILCCTATQIDPTNPSWVANGVGRFHSDLYGFGQVNAGRAVVMARDWTDAKRTPHAMLAKYVAMDAEIPSTRRGVVCGVEVTSEEVAQIESIEHVVVFVSTRDHEARGDLRILLTSPSGTKSVLTWASGDEGATAPPDGQYAKHKFMTVKNWGENATGIWKLRVIDRREDAHDGRMASWILAIYGKCSQGADDPSCRKIMQPESLTVCEDTCRHRSDGECDDGGVGYHYSACTYGSDCSDCGNRYVDEGAPIMYDFTGLGAVLIDSQATCIDVSDPSSASDAAEMEWFIASTNETTEEGEEADGQGATIDEINDAHTPSSGTCLPAIVAGFFQLLLLGHPIF